MNTLAIATDLEDSEPLVVISPHLDDAVMSCGDLLSHHAGSTVITVFAGRAPIYRSLTSWDAKAGFKNGQDVMAARRREDASALSLLKATPCWLEFVDSQYGGSSRVAAIVPELRKAIVAAGATRVLAPLGLFHADHERTSNAALALARELPELAWFLYEDAIYRATPGLVGKRIARLRSDGWRLTALRPVESARHKQKAVRAYKSQLKALSAPGHPGFADAFEPERYYRLDRVSE